MCWVGVAGSYSIGEVPHEGALGHRLQVCEAHGGEVGGHLREEAPLGPPKRGVSKPTVYDIPKFPSYRNMPSCLGQWSATYL